MSGVRGSLPYAQIADRGTDELPAKNNSKYSGLQLWALLQGSKMQQERVRRMWRDGEQ